MKFAESMLRLYAVTYRSWTGEKTLFEQVESVLKGGATCVQLRKKELDYDAFLAEAVRMKALCSRYGVPLIVNDNVEIALRCGADGVHIGQEDMEAKDVRAMAGDRLIIGVTAKTVDQALAAQRAGADYLGSGAVFGSTTKTSARPLSCAALREICRAVSIPVVAIGGSDSSGGAGIQADIKTMSAHGIYAMSAITALTAQNTTGVTDILEATPAFLSVAVWSTPYRGGPRHGGNLRLPAAAGRRCGHAEA